MPKTLFDAIDSSHFADDDATSIDGTVACRDCCCDFILIKSTVPGESVPVTDYTLPVPMLIDAITEDCAAGHPTLRFRSDGLSVWKMA